METNTLLLTFNSATIPPNLKIFYRIIPVELYIPNPLRCFNCQRFGHHESNCSEDPGSVCERCGKGNHDHHTSQCKNPIKCVNCGKDHTPKSNLCEIWEKEKEIIKIKVTKNITFPEARKLFELIPKPVYSKIPSVLLIITFCCAQALSCENPWVSNYRSNYPISGHKASSVLNYAW